MNCSSPIQGFNESDLDSVKSDLNSIPDSSQSYVNLIHDLNLDSPEVLLMLKSDKSLISPKAQDIPKEDTSENAKTDTKTSGRNNREHHLPHFYETRTKGHEEPQRGTSRVEQMESHAHPRWNTPSRVRWKLGPLSMDHGDSIHNENEKHFKKKKKHKSNSGAKDPADDGSPIITGGIIAGILLLMAFATGFYRVW